MDRARRKETKARKYWFSGVEGCVPSIFMDMTLQRCGVYSIWSMSIPEHLVGSGIWIDCLMTKF